MRIKQSFPLVKVGGIDINEDSIEEAKKILPEAELIAGVAEVLPFPDKSYDVILTDATLIYLNWYEIERCIKEIKRVGRKYVLFVEFLTRTNALLENLYSRNYDELLKDFDFKDVKCQKMAKEDWDDEFWQKYGYYITAKI